MFFNCKTVSVRQNTLTLSYLSTRPSSAMQSSLYTAMAKRSTEKLSSVFSFLK